MPRRPGRIIWWMALLLGAAWLAAFALLVFSLVTARWLGAGVAAGGLTLVAYEIHVFRRAVARRITRRAE